MEQTLEYISIGIFATFCILSIYKSIKYGITTHSFWKGILLFLILGIIAFGIFYTGWLSFIKVYFWTFEEKLLPWLVFFIISSSAYWYGILGFNGKIINRILSLGGFIVFIITSLMVWGRSFIFSDFRYLLGSIIIGSTMIYTIVRIWNIEQSNKI